MATLLSIDSSPVASTAVSRMPPLARVATTFSTSSRALRIRWSRGPPPPRRCAGLADVLRRLPHRLVGTRVARVEVDRDDCTTGARPVTELLARVDHGLDQDGVGLTVRKHPLDVLVEHRPVGREINARHGGTGKVHDRDLRVGTRTLDGRDKRRERTAKILRRWQDPHRRLRRIDQERDEQGLGRGLRRNHLTSRFVLAHDKILGREARSPVPLLRHDRDERGLLLLRERRRNRRHQGHRQQGRADQTHSHTTLLVGPSSERCRDGDESIYLAAADERTRRLGPPTRTADSLTDDRDSQSPTPDPRLFHLIHGVSNTFPPLLVSICVDFTSVFAGRVKVTVYCESRLLAMLLSINSSPVASTTVRRMPPLARVTTFSTSSRLLEEADVRRTEAVHTVAPDLLMFSAASFIVRTALESRELKSTDTIARRGLGLSTSFFAASTSASITTPSACRFGNRRWMYLSISVAELGEVEDGDRCARVLDDRNLRVGTSPLIAVTNDVNARRRSCVCEKPAAPAGAPSGGDKVSTRSVTKIGSAARCAATTGRGALSSRTTKSFAVRLATGPPASAITVTSAVFCC